MTLETWEMLSYIVTVVGLPAAILAFLFEKKKERETAEDEVHQLLSDIFLETPRRVFFPGSLIFAFAFTADCVHERCEGC